jgi:hypothetical protein
VQTQCAQTASEAGPAAPPSLLRGGAGAATSARNTVVPARCRALEAAKKWRFALDGRAPSTAAHPYKLRIPSAHITYFQAPASPRVLSPCRVLAAETRGSDGGHQRDGNSENRTSRGSPLRTRWQWQRTAWGRCRWHKATSQRTAIFAAAYQKTRTQYGGPVTQAGLYWRRQHNELVATTPGVSGNRPGPTAVPHR